jgi:hypothetical protein
VDFWYLISRWLEKSQKNTIPLIVLSWLFVDIECPDYNFDPIQILGTITPIFLIILLFFDSLPYQHDKSYWEWHLFKWHVCHAPPN